MYWGYSGPDYFVHNDILRSIYFMFCFPCLAVVCIAVLVLLFSSFFSFFLLVALPVSFYFIL